MLRRSPSEALAVAGVGLLLLVPLAPLGLGVGPFDAVTVGMPLAVLLAAPWLAGELAAGRDSGVRFGILLPVSAFLFAALLSVAGNPGADTAATFVRYAFYLLLTVVVGRVATAGPVRRALESTLAVTGSLTVLYAFYQYVRPTKAIGLTGVVGASTRVFSTFDNPNFYGEFLVLLIPLLLCLATLERGRRRLMYAGMGLAALVALLLTYTRGSWIALAAGLAVAMYLAKMRQRWTVAVVVPAVALAIPGVLPRILSIFSLEGTAAFRLRLWRIAGEVMLRHPVFGVGIGRFYDGFQEVVVARPDLANGYLEYGAHNSFLAIAGETGFLGAIAFVWLVVAILRRGLLSSGSLTDRAHTIENALLTAGIIAFAINGLTSNAFQHPKGALFFFVLVGLQLGVHREAAIGSLPAHAGPTLGDVLDGSRAARTLRPLLRGLRDAWAASVSRRALGSLGEMVSASLVARVMMAVAGASARADSAESGLLTRVARASAVVRAGQRAARFLGPCWAQSTACRLLAAPPLSSEAVWWSSRAGRRAASVLSRSGLMLARSAEATADTVS